MAEAKALPAPAPPEHVVVELRLTKKEAQALTDVVASCGGHPGTTRRKHTSDIYDAMSKLGYSYNLTDVVGTIKFQE